MKYFHLGIDNFRQPHVFNKIQHFVYFGIDQALIAASQCETDLGALINVICPYLCHRRVEMVSDSPNKSLQMQEEKNWAADAVRFFQSDADKIGFEVSVRVSENTGTRRDDVKVGLWKRIDWGTALWTDGIAFTDNGTIVARDMVAIEETGQVLQSYVPGQWYKIRFELNRQNRCISVWIDGELKGQNINEHNG